MPVLLSSSRGPLQHVLYAIEQLWVWVEWAVVIQPEEEGVPALLAVPIYSLKLEKTAVRPHPF